MIYWDTSYLAKLYLNEPGTKEVFALLAEPVELVCSEHGRLELMITFKRNQREGLLTQSRLDFLWEKHTQDLQEGLIRYLPLSSGLVQNTCARLGALSPAVFLRAADALHLASAAEAGLKTIYSHDRHLLAAAPHFGLKGIDVIPL